MPGGKSNKNTFKRLARKEYCSAIAQNDFDNFLSKIAKPKNAKHSKQNLVHEIYQPVNTSSDESLSYMR